jgi:hypothetical protein
LLTGAVNGVGADIQCRGNLTVAPGLAGRRGVGLQQDSCFQELTGRGFALLDQRVEPFTLLGSELDDVFFGSRLFRGNGTSPELPEISIQRSAAESTREALA